MIPIFNEITGIPSGSIRTISTKILFIWHLTYDILLGENETIAFWMTQFEGKIWNGSALTVKRSEKLLATFILKYLPIDVSRSVWWLKIQINHVKFQIEIFRTEFWWRLSVFFSSRWIDLLSVRNFHPLIEIHFTTDQIHSFLCFMLNHVNNMRRYLSKFSWFLFSELKRWCKNARSHEKICRKNRHFASLCLPHAFKSININGKIED